MKYSIEIGKIIDGAIKNDYEKVKAYVNKLIRELKEDGDSRTAKKFEKQLAKKTGNNLVSPSSLMKNIPVDSESHLKLAKIIYPDNSNIKVALTENNMTQIEDFMLNYKLSDKLHEAGIDRANSLLLYGPPGCGKSKTAHLIANELNLPLVIARLDSLISSYLGTTSKNIRTLFEYIDKMPCILFLDEFDAIAKARDDSNELGELKRVVNSLLQNIDNLNKESIFIAATNHDKLLDFAVWRRFDYKIKIEFPNKNSIIKIINIFIDNHLSLSKKNYKLLTSAFLGLTGAEIEDIITKAIRSSILYNKQLNIILIFEEFFKIKNLVNKDNSINKELLTKRAKFLRQLNEKIFSYSVIADILEISKSYVYKLIRKE